MGKLTQADAHNTLAPTRPALMNTFCGGQGCAGVVPGRSYGGPTWQAEILIMALVTGYVGATLFLTSRRAGLIRSTLVKGAAAGLLANGLAAMFTTVLGTGPAPGSDAWSSWPALPITNGE